MIGLRKIAPLILVLGILRGGLGSELVPSYDLRISDQGDQQPISLREAIGSALVSNLEIQIESITPKVLAHQTRQSMGVFDPSIEAGSRYETLRTPQSSQEFVSTGGTRFSDGRLFGRTRIFAEDNLENRAGVVGKLPIGAEYDVGIRADRFNNDLTRDPTVSRFDNEYRNFTGVTITQPLLKNFGRDVNFSKICVSQKDKLIADQEFRIKVATVVRKTIDAYYDCYIAYEDLKVKRYEIEVMSRLADEKVDQLERGAATEEAIAIIRSNLSEAYERFLLCRQTLLTKNGDLVMLIQGDFDFDAFPIYLPTEAPNSIIPPTNPNKLMSDAIKHRPEYLIALENVEKLGIVLQYRENQTLPKVDLEGTMGHTSLAGEFGNGFTQSLEREGYDYGVGVSVSIPLGGNKENRALLAETLELKKQAVLQVKQEEMRAQMLINRHLTSLDIHRKRLAASRKSTSLELQNLEKIKERLELGTARESDVMTANRDISNTKLRQHSAASDFQRSLADLRYTTGTLLAYYDIEVLGANECLPARATHTSLSTGSSLSTGHDSVIIAERVHEEPAVAAKPLQKKRGRFLSFKAKRKGTPLFTKKQAIVHQASEGEEEISRQVIIPTPIRATPVE